jgi:hypothetical protein
MGMGRDTCAALREQTMGIVVNSSVQRTMVSAGCFEVDVSSLVSTPFLADWTPLLTMLLFNRCHPRRLLYLLI